jgi:hypothetical protein
MKQAPADPHGAAPEAGPSPALVDRRTRAERAKRALIDGLVGRKVSVSTNDLHHVVGRLIAIDGDDRLVILVNNQKVHVRRQGVARIHEAEAALAEYLK